MGVHVGMISMSNSDVVYNHKKFKRAASEVWEGSDESLSCSRTQTNSSQPIQKSHSICEKINGYIDSDFNVGTPELTVESKFIKSDHTVNPNRGIYKPKFRGQYSDNESDHSLHPVAAIIQASDAATVSDNNKSVISRPNVTVIELGTCSNDESGVEGKNFGSSSIWNAIKSPSPELVGQHINKLIVENQAIIDVHSPSWPRRYRRQSSAGSSGDCDITLHSKSRRNSLSEQQLKLRVSPFGFRSCSPLKVSNDRFEAYPVVTCTQFQANPVSGLVLHHPSLDAKATSLYLVPNPQTTSSYVVNTTDISRYSLPLYEHSLRKNTDIESSSLIKDLNSRGVQLFETLPLSPVAHKSVLSDRLELTKSSLPKIIDTVGQDIERKAVFCCSKCKVSFFNIEALEQHLRTCNGYIPSNQDETRYYFQAHNASKCQSDTALPPSKRRKYVDSPVISHSVVHMKLSNGQVYLKPKDTLEKADSTEDVEITESPNVDRKAVIVEKHSIQRQEAWSPNSSVSEIPVTSSVVTIAKSGLNSGGTVVQFENKNSDKIDTLSDSHLQLPFTSKGFSRSVYSKEMFSPIQLGSYHQYAPSLQLPNLSIPGVPIPKITILSNSNISKKLQSSQIYVVKAQPLTSTTKIDSLEGNQVTVLQQGQLDISSKKIPYVPGIPGPYSTEGLVPLISVTKLKEDDQASTVISNTDNEVTTSVLTSKHSDLKPELPEIVIQHVDKAVTILGSENSSNLLSEDQFKVPAKRPNTLAIKPQLFIPKTSLALIGSTLVSPDTPRPKKSCAQLLLNGSAYTYLGLKCSTKSFYCCIYRPQPMYVPQSTNPKLSMYSNWQTKGSTNSSLSTTEALGLYVSGTYRNTSYTIASPKEVVLVLTHSKYWSDKSKKGDVKKFERKESAISEDDVKESDENSSLDSNHSVVAGTSNRIKIFEGGFKSNEEYTYIRGRGRGRFVCSTCGIRCKKPSMLKKHIRTHTNVRPYSCKHCSFSFKTKGNLTKHLKSKTHFKRCLEVGISFSQSLRDDTSINEDFFSNEDCDDTDKTPGDDYDEENTDDSEDDEDEEDDEDLDDEMFEDAKEDFDLYNDRSSGQQEESCSTSDSMDSCLEDSPIDLSLKRKLSSKMSANTASLSSIISPVKDLSLMLKSVYDLTQKATASSESDQTEQNNVAPLPKYVIQFQRYVEERAIVDSAIKRSQCCQSTSYDENTALASKSCTFTSTIATPNSSAYATTFVTTSLIATSDSLFNVGSIRIKNVHALINDMVEESSVTPTSTSTESKAVVIVEAPKPSSSSDNSSASSVVTGFPSAPANLTVIKNTSADDGTTSFLSPSWTVPSSSNRNIAGDEGKCKCSICHEEFHKHYRLSLHMSTHYIERPYKCDSCAVSFRTNGHLQKHKRSGSHFNKVNMNLTFGIPSTDNPRPFKCHDCKVAFRIHGHLAKHLRSKTHILKLECLGKLPFGTYAEIERCGDSLNEIDTSGCEKSLDSLQALASRLHAKDPSKLADWKNQQTHIHTASSSSNNSDDYPLEEEQEDGFCSYDESRGMSKYQHSECSDWAIEENKHYGDAVKSGCSSDASNCSIITINNVPVEVGQGAMEGMLGCPVCCTKFVDIESLKAHIHAYHKDVSVPQNKPLSCKFCNAKFATSAQVAAHCAARHSSNAIAEDEDNSER